MTRWDYDTVFYRVFCTALLGVALTFTIVLTNVFIDIDGLLYKKNTDNTDNQEAEQVKKDVVTTSFVPEDDAYEYKDYGDSSAAERTKRSLEPQDLSFQIKDPRIKKVITNHLAELLEDLDKEESSKTNHEVILKSIDHDKDVVKSGKYKIIKDSEKERKNTRKYKTNDVELLDIKKTREDLDDNFEILDDIERIQKEKDKNKKYNQTEDELKHLVMHNIILKGIIAHMDLGEVYAKVHALIHNVKSTEDSKDYLKEIIHQEQDKPFLHEIINCKQLKEQIAAETNKPEIKKVTASPTGRNVMIKTIIDITSLANDKTNQDDALSKENVNGIIKFIYNGKALKFRRVDDVTTTAKTMVFRRTDERISADIRVDSSNGENIKEAKDKILDSDKSRIFDTYVPNVYVTKMINEYLKKISKESESSENIKKLTTKRLKRHVKIQYDNEETDKTISEIPKVKRKNEDDELFVEIETHFDSKGLKGEKKKKMIRDLIEKIQNAIHPGKETKKKHKHLHVKKRTQNPLDSGNTASFVSKMLMPLDNLIPRNIDPISKSVPLHEALPYVSDNKGDDWRRGYNGPRFLTGSKAMNSAEISEVDTDYNRIMDNGIPQRLQQPLNTDSKDEPWNFNNIQDPGNAKFTVKNIAGSGFSIGFNQYVDEPPDAESMKLFTGIKNIIQTYHQKYDEDAKAVNTNQEDRPSNQGYQEYQQNREESRNQEYLAPKRDEHLIIRRSIKNIKRDYHSNEYKVIFNKNFLNYDNYQDVYNSKGHDLTSQSSKRKDATRSLVLDNNIFNKDLKPSEIFSLADLLERQKRSFNVKKISNIKNKKVLNRYINTKSMASKKIFKQNKRNKRQIDKIRIIAKDLPVNPRHNSEEDVFVLSDEKVFADRALVREVETPDMERNERTNEEHYHIISPQKPDEDHFDIITPQKVSEDHYDIISPQKETENHYDIISPYIYQAPIENNVFARRSRHNSLMSKYPHIFMEEITRSKEEDFMLEKPVVLGKMKDKFPVMITTPNAPANNIAQPQFIPQPDFNNPGIQKIDDHYPSPDKSNYKVSVKIMPKNNTGLGSGFKEIHTSINKSYNKNGLVYTSLVNVSEISKVEKMNKTKGKYELAHPSVTELKREQSKMKSIIQQHKDRIEEQISHLNREKEKLDRIDTRNSEFLKDLPKDYIDVPLPTNPARTLHLTKEDFGRFFNFEETTTSEVTTTTEVTTTSKQSTKTIPTTIKYVEPITEDPEKVKIINTIERNEVITNEILKKIDKNTDILQTFLDKLMSKMETPAPVTKKPEEYHSTPRPVYKDANNYEERPLNNPQQVSKTNDMYDRSLRNLFFNPMLNGSAGIPFVYAFQQPYTIPNSDNNNVPIASVVYQGHIQTNTMNMQPNKYSRRNLKENEIRDKKEKMEWRSNAKPVVKNNFKAKNSTKFFIDDLENDYKVLPIVGKTVFSGNLANTTKV